MGSLTRPWESLILDEAGGVGLRLLNEYQHDFPLVPRPFALLAADLGVDEETVMEVFRRGLGSGAVSRIGAVVAPRRMGASALAALSAPDHMLEAVAARVSELPEVNHNYQREHPWNLWFVVTAPSPARLAAIVSDIEDDTGLAVIVLPLEEEFHLDLGFDLAGSGCAPARRPMRASPAAGGAPRSLDAAERRLMAALQDGLPLAPRPYDALALRTGLAEPEVLGLIGRWLDEGLVRRFGVVVRHRELGFAANAMCVWDVPDDRVGAIGRALAAEEGVTLCYRRRRALPHWRYNLFCMIHGRERGEVSARRDEIAARLGLDHWPSAVLFSVKRFKQQGARYFSACEALHG